MKEKISLVQIFLSDEELKDAPKVYLEAKKKYPEAIVKIEWDNAIAGQTRLK